MERENLMLLEPYRTGDLTFRNRLAMAAVTRGMADADGCATPEMLRYYERFARHGLGLIVTEAIYIAEELSQTYVRQPGMQHSKNADSWAPIVEAVQAHGTLIFAQLQHGGAFREPTLGPGLNATNDLPATLSWQQRLPYEAVIPADKSAMDRVVEGFRVSAALVQETGFDGIELHGARGYLLDAFMSGTNRRDDGYGGKLADRMRFPRAVVETVRQAAPDIRLSYNLSLYKMDTPVYEPPGARDEIEAIVEMLRSAGVDMIHVTTRAVDRCVVDGEPLLDIVRGCFEGPLIANGGIKSIDDAETLLRLGRADMVSMARSLIANPDILARCRKADEMAEYKRGMEKSLS